MNISLYAIVRLLVAFALVAGLLILRAEEPKTLKSGSGGVIGLVDEPKPADTSGASESRQSTPSGVDQKAKDIQAELETLRSEIALLKAQNAWLQNEMSIWENIPVIEVRLNLKRENAKAEQRKEAEAEKLKVAAQKPK